MLWPPDMPDEMLNDTIAAAKKALDDNQKDIAGKGDLVISY